jgi:hypothetical protein
MLPLSLRILKAANKAANNSIVSRLANFTLITY